MSTTTTAAILRAVLGKDAAILMADAIRLGAGIQLPSGAKLYARRRGCVTIWMVSGYAYDGRDVAPYRPKADAAGGAA